jgi:hypothetical protein
MTARGLYALQFHALAIKLSAGTACEYEPPTHSCCTCLLALHFDAFLLTSFDGGHRLVNSKYGREF